MTVSARRLAARRLLAPLVVVATLLVAGCTPAPTEQEAVSSSMTVDVDGVTRDFELRVPAHESSETLPVVMFLHGLGLTPQDMEGFTGATDRIEEDRFIAVYPAGLVGTDGETRSWNAGNCCNEIGVEKHDDIGFLTALIDEMPDYGGDPDSIFLAGFSNGGMLAYRAACDLGDEIAGIAVVAGAYNVSECSSTDPMPVVIVHGLLDPYIPYDGGESPPEITDGYDPYVHPSVVFAVDTWVERDDCDTDGETDAVGSAEAVHFTGCAPGTSVDLYSVPNTYHEWPGTDQGFETTDVILSTFLGV
jgi:polyhydroxybutyrate depolymerase